MLSKLTFILKRSRSTYSKNPKAILIIITGMCLAIVTVLLTFSHTFYLSTADNWLEETEYIYALSFSEDRYLGTSPSVAMTLFPEFPEIEDYALIKNPTDQILRSGSGDPVRVNLYIVNEGFGRLFKLDCLYGNIEEALSIPSSVIISESTARNLFGSVDVLGRTVKYNTRYFLTVRAVIPDLPENSVFNFDGLISYTSLRIFDPTGSYLNSSNNSNIFLKVTPYTGTDDLHGDLFDKYIETRGWEKRTVEGELLPFNELYFRNDIRDDFYNHCEKNYLVFLSFFSLLILSIAVLNNVNLYSAIVFKRFRDNCIEKIHGAFNRNILVRNMIESVLIITVSYILAFVLAKYLTERLSDSELFPVNSILFSNAAAIACQLIIVVVLGVVTGLLATIHFIRILEKPRQNKSKVERSVFSKRAFLVFQFLLASIIIISTIISTRQYSFINNTDQGFNKDDILCVDTYGTDSLGQFELRQSLLAMPQLNDVSFTWGVPGAVRDYWGNILSIPGKEDKYINTSVIQASNSFPEMMGMELLTGNYPDDYYRQESYIINEKAMLEFGLSEEDIGVATIGRNEGKILGVVKDFNFESLHSPIAPVVIFMSPYAYNNLMLVKLNVAEGNDRIPIIESIKVKWTDFFPELPFNYYYLEDLLNDLYIEEARFRTAGLFFSIISMLIALMGLVAITSLASANRSKEIAIRKVNGALTLDLYRLFTLSFGKTVLLGFVLSVPLSYLISSRWLGNFAYRIEISWIIWLTGGTIIILISLFTLFVSIYPVIQLYPIRYLRSE